MAVIGTPKAMPAVWVPGLATLNVLVPAGLTVKVPVEPVVPLCDRVKFVVVEDL